MPQHVISQYAESLPNFSTSFDLFFMAKYTAQTKRVLSLSDPTQKMSKSAPNVNSRILITDSPQDISRKISRAVTDSDRTLTWDPEGRRGVSNLLTILEACSTSGQTGQSQSTSDTTFDSKSLFDSSSQQDQEKRMCDLADRLASQGISSHAQLKDRVSESVIEKLRPIREEYLKLVKDDGYLHRVAVRGQERASQIAATTMKQVRKKMGLCPI